MLLTNMAEINELFVKNERHRIRGTNSMLCNDINIYAMKSVVMRMILRHYVIVVFKCGR